MSLSKPTLLFWSFKALLAFGVCASMFLGSGHRSQTAMTATSRIVAEDKSQECEKLQTQDEKAWCEFRILVHATKPFAKGKPAPEWNNWASKVDVGIGAPCIGKNQDPKKPLLSVDLRSMEYPNQTLISIQSDLIGGKFRTFGLLVDDFVKAPQLASVLFDPVAKTAVRNLNLCSSAKLDARVDWLNQHPSIVGINRALPPKTFTTGSRAIKLIWEVVKSTGQSGRPQTAYLYSSANVPHQSGESEIPPVKNWSPVNLDTTHPEEPCSEPLNPASRSIPVSCLFYYYVDPKAADVDEEISELTADGANVIGPPLTGSYIILVGVHLMKLEPGNPSWVWSTYFWSPPSNNQNGWMPPWNHFQMMTVTKLRDDSKYPGQSQNICFSPYLEGTGTNGLEANCLNCHSFAAYSPRGSRSSAVEQYGQKYPFQESAIDDAERNYFVGAVQTSFMWSIGESQDTHRLDGARQALNNALRKDHLPLLLSKINQ